jgi:putative redox protein
LPCARAPAFDAAHANQREGQVRTLHQSIEAQPAAAGEPQPGDVIVEETGAGGLQVAVQAAGTHFLADEPVEAGGLGSGPNPYDLLGAALGACTAMTLRLYARHKGLPLDGVRVAVRHERRDKDVFIREIRLIGELDDAQRKRLLQIAEHCPVHRTLTAGAQIETRAELLSPVPTASDRVRLDTPR